MKMSPLQVCLDGLNYEAEGRARFDFLSIAKNRKVRHTHKAGPREPKLELMVQRRWRSGCRMGMCHKGSIGMEMSDARSMHDTWKDSSTA